MTKDISRREFLENIGLGAAAGTSLLLLKDVAHAQPGNAHPGDDQPSNDQPSAALSLPHPRTNRRQSFHPRLRLRQPLPYV